MTLLKGLWERVVATSEGAALGTGTRVEHEVIHGNFNVLPNETLSHVMDNSLQAVGGVLYSATERAFADSLPPPSATSISDSPPLPKYNRDV